MMKTCCSSRSRARGSDQYTAPSHSRQRRKHIPRQLAQDIAGDLDAAFSRSPIRTSCDAMPTCRAIPKDASRWMYLSGQQGGSSRRSWAPYWRDVSVRTKIYISVLADCAQAPLPCAGRANVVPALTPGMFNIGVQVAPANAAFVVCFRIAAPHKKKISVQLDKIFFCAIVQALAFLKPGIFRGSIFHAMQVGPSGFF